MNKEILKLAVPNVISNLSIPLLSTVDTILMGQLSAKHLAAVGISSMIFNFFYWNFGFLRMGTTGMTAQAYGSHDNKAISLILYRSLLLATIIAAALLLFQQGVLYSSSYLLNVGDNYSLFVEQYFSIRIMAAPATLALYSLIGWYFGMQNAIIPMIVTIAINIINILLSLYLVQYWNMGINGVAYGTVVAQYLGLLIAVIYLFKFKSNLKQANINDILKWMEVKKFLNINKDIFFRTICLTFAFAFLYSQSAKGGTISLAVMVVLLQFLNWMSYFIDGFAFAAESLVGKYFGRKDSKQLFKAVNYSIYWGSLLALLFALIYYLGGEYILALFTDDQLVIDEALKLMIWTIIMPIAGYLAYIWDGVFIGLTKVKAMRNSMIISLSIYMILFYSLNINTLDGFWITFLVFLASRGLIQTIQYYTNIKPQLDFKKVD